MIANHQFSMKNIKKKKHEQMKHMIANHHFPNEKRRNFNGIPFKDTKEKST